LSYLANRQTNKLGQKHYLLGGGNKRSFIRSVIYNHSRYL